ncbi:unnamed protein product, partial [Sphacelaria rigidula]
VPHLAATSNSAVRLSSHGGGPVYEWAPRWASPPHPGSLGLKSISRPQLGSLPHRVNLLSTYSSSTLCVSHPTHPGVGLQFVMAYKAQGLLRTSAHPRCVKHPTVDSQKWG